MLPSSCSSAQYRLCVIVLAAQRGSIAPCVKTKVDSTFTYAYTLCGHEFVASEKIDKAFTMGPGPTTERFFVFSLFHFLVVAELCRGVLWCIPSVFSHLP